MSHPEVLRGWDVSVDLGIGDPEHLVTLGEGSKRQSDEAKEGRRMCDLGGQDSCLMVLVWKSGMFFAESCCMVSPDTSIVWPTRDGAWKPSPC